MSQGHLTLKDRMLSRLTLAVRWVSGAELAQGLSNCQPAIEDALADLWLEGLAEFDAARGYRLSCAELCREPLRALRREIAQVENKNMLRRRFLAKDCGDVIRIGVAEHRPNMGLVVYELELPFPDGETTHEDINRRVEAMLKVADACMKKEGLYA